MLMSYGSGAGKLPTARAVVADVVAYGVITSAYKYTLTGNQESFQFVSYDDSVNRFFVRTDSKRRG